MHGHRGSLLFLPGRGDAYEKYLEALDDWHRRRWWVTAIDWRGQGGSGRFGNDPLTGHIDDFGQWVGDLAYFWERWQVSRPGPHVVVAHSMGGHLALRALAERRIDPAALVLVAPMLGLARRAPMSLLQGVAKAMGKLRDPRRPAWRWREQPDETGDDTPGMRMALLTHDGERYADEVWWRQQRPELEMGPGSWGWVERACASMRALRRPGVLEGVTTPVLILGASNDALISYRAIERSAARLPFAELVRFGVEARHEILRESDPVRNRALSRIDEFLNRVVPTAR